MSGVQTAEEAVPGAGAGAGDVHTPEELVGLTPEQAEQLRAEWSRELARIRQSSELKRKLGITVWKEITEDVNQGLKNVKESQIPKNGICDKVDGGEDDVDSGWLHGRRVHQARPDAQLGGKVASRSNSTQSFDDALRDASRGASGATSPTIPEHKPLP
ncbi:hypothetical protein MSG28_011082 [Choristoneura fumiferana]|uniref:Uncharacterized protein n=1 Tax=Choristoneura fumiferana TaxID=7141 RepID=A0ACC0KQV6_CHOFU|nr:hypothetical protein MSG28_011082 [Choristoneura fumiferana]